MLHTKVLRLVWREGAPHREQGKTGCLFHFFVLFLISVRKGDVYWIFSKPGVEETVIQEWRILNLTLMALWPKGLSACFFFFFFKSWFLFLLYFTLQYCIGFAIHWHVSTMDVHVIPNMNPLSHLPPHNIPLGHPRAPAPSMLYPASDIDWWFDSYMIVFMLQCHSPKSSHPLPLPQSPKVRYTPLCLFCCLAYRVVTAIFSSILIELCLLSYPFY